MKGISRFAAFIFILFTLLLPLTALAAAPQDMSISVQWKDAVGGVHLSDPAVPLTGAPDETRFWITLPWDAPTVGLTLNISDLTGGFVSFLPNQGDELIDVYDALGTLNFPPVQIKCFNAEGELQAIYSLYLSSQPMPEISATEAPAPVSAQVTVHYVDENGMTLRSDVVYNFDGGAHQITAADIDQYTVTGAADYTVTVDGSGAWPNEVTFVYTRVIPAAAVTVHYVDENLQTLLPDKVEMAPGGTQMIYAESISGYALAGPEALPVTVTMEGASPSEITFMYALQAQPVEIRVHYVDVNGNPLAADTVKTVQPGSNTVYPEASISPDQYLLTGAPYYEVYVTAQGANPPEVTFTYQRVAQAALVTIHYVDDQGTPIAADDYRTLEPGIHQLTPEAVLPADEYALISPESVAVIVDVNGASQQEVTFTYQRQVRPVTVILHYVDDRGETIAEDSVLTYGAGEYIITPAATIASNLYILREPSAYSLNVNLDSAPVNEVTFTYDRAVQPAAVTVYYTDSQGNPVADATEQVFQGGSFAIFAQPQNLKPNYTLPADDPGFRNVTVDVDGAHPDTVTFVYEYNAPAPWVVSVLYVDMESGLYVATAQTVELAAGQATPISAQPVDLLSDYVLVSEPIVYVTVDAFGQGDVNEVVFRYQYVEPTPEPTEEPTPEPTEEPTPAPTAEPTEAPTPEPTEEPTEAPTAEPTAVPAEEPETTEEPENRFALVTVRYLDQTGKTVASDAQFVCAYGDTRILADPVDLQPGYELQGEDSVIVHVDENGASPSVVVFAYAYPAADVPAPKVALVNVKYVDPDGNVFYSYPVTCVEGQENPITVDMSQVSPDWGYKLASDSVVYVTVDHDGAAAPSEVIFKFSIELVTVRYVDMLTGLEVASAQQQQCYVGANLIDARPYDLLPGYALYGEASAVVTLTADGTLTPAEVIFQYIFQATATPEPAPPAYDIPMNAYFYPTGSSVRIRSTPTTAENNIIGSANSGDLGHALGYLVTADNKVWYAVEINGIMGYMSDTVVRFLSEPEIAALFGYTLPPTEAPTPAPTAIPDGAVIDCWAITTTKVNFRRSTSRSSDPIDSLKKNTRVWVYSSSTVNGEKWYAVRVNGTDGYLMADYVQVYTAEESAAIQAQLASPMPTQIPTPTPTPAPTLPPTEAPTEIPTEAPTAAPTEIPTAEPTETPEPTAGPTDTPAPYRGYALTNGQAALRTGVSQTDDTILEMLPDQSLMIVNGQTYVEGVPWASAQAVGSGNLGFILQSSLTPITSEEARPYLEKIQATPAATATPVPEQTTGYAMTLGDGVPMRNFPDTNGEILMLLPYMAVANVRGQQYAGGDAWHLVQYNGMWGYIRQDQLRMMSAEEVQAYEQNLTAGTPTPTAAPTPEPVTQESLSSYGHVQSTSGRVNLRSEPTTKNNNAIRLLDNYAFALVLGTVTNDEGTWYHVSQGGNEGYIRGDYFHVLSLGELSEFLQSSEYLNANSNNTSTSATSSQIQPVEDYNRTVWQNPALTASYEPFNPYTTPTPDPERLYTATPVPTQTPTPAPTSTPEIAPVGPQGNMTLEPNVQEGGSPWPWVLGGLAVLCGGAAYGYYVYNQNEKRKRQMRESQARQARSAAAQRPQMRAARNNPTQGAGRAAYPSQNRGAYMPPQNSASRPAAMPGQPSADGTSPYQTNPTENQTYQSARPDSQIYQSVRMETQKYQRQQTQNYRPDQTGGSVYTASRTAGVQNGGSAPLTQNPQAVRPQTPAANGQGLYQDMNAAGTIPEEASAQSDMGNTKRIRRTDRNKAKYDGDNNQNT